MTIPDTHFLAVFIGYFSSRKPDLCLFIVFSMKQRKKRASEHKEESAPAFRSVENEDESHSPPPGGLSTVQEGKTAFTCEDRKTISSTPSSLARCPRFSDCSCFDSGSGSSCF